MRNEVRASDAERDSAALVLREHFVQGRLTLDELKGRLDTVLTARTRGQLDGVLADLPTAKQKQPVPAPKPAVPAVSDRYIAVTILILVMVAWLLATAWFSQRGYGYPHPPPYPGR
jgi:Domain of unknown function (DUF1707)